MSTLRKPQANRLRDELRGPTGPTDRLGTDPHGAENRSTANAFLRRCTLPNVHEDVVEVGIVQEPRPTVIKRHGVHLDAHAFVVADEESPGHWVTLEADVEAPHVGTAYLELIPDPLDDVLVAAVDGDRVCNGTA